MCPQHSGRQEQWMPCASFHSLLVDWVFGRCVADERNWVINTRGLNFKLLEDPCCVLVAERVKDASHFAVSDRLRKCPTPVQHRHPFEDRHTRDCHVICSVSQNEQADTLGPTETRWITPTSGGDVTVNIHPDPIEKTRAKQCEKVSFFFSRHSGVAPPFSDVLVEEMHCFPTSFHPFLC